EHEDERHVVTCKPGHVNALVSGAAWKRDSTGGVQWGLNCECLVGINDFHEGGRAYNTRASSVIEQVARRSPWAQSPVPVESHIGCSAYSAGNCEGPVDGLGRNDSLVGENRILESRTRDGTTIHGVAHSACRREGSVARA